MNEHESEHNSNPSDRASTPSAPVATARVTSAELLGSAKEIIIEHQGRDYRLRLTQNGKLILTA